LTFTNKPAVAQTAEPLVSMKGLLLLNSNKSTQVCN